MGAWKTVRITKPCTIKIKNSNLLVKDNANEFILPIKDIDLIIFEGNQFTITAKALVALSKNKIATIFCDNSYLPTAILHPYHQSSLATKTLKMQLSVTQDFANTLWQQIIKAKINLQKEVLKVLNKEYDKLEKYFLQVHKADKYGAEAKSAKYYWNKLFNKLIREPHSFDIRNQALNYAYAIIRSMITRDLSAAGFLPAIGIWHNNIYNAFNLADDLMEPFRPILDIAVYKILDNNKVDFINPKIKKEIIKIFDLEYIEYEKGLTSIRNCSKLYIKIFKKSIEKKDPMFLSYPMFNIKKLNECL